MLLIDEVDVFFDQRFDGALYRPAIRLRQRCVVELLEFIWVSVQASEDPKSLTPEVIYRSEVYQRVITELPILEPLIENQVHGMLAAAKDPSHAYHIINKRITYEDNDGLTTRINYGYKTTFAYIQEFSKNRPGYEVISP